MFMPGHLGCGISLAFIGGSASSYSLAAIDSVNGQWILVETPTLLYYQPVIVVPMETEIELNHFGNLILVHLDTNTLQDPLAKATLSTGYKPKYTAKETTQAANRNCKIKKKKTHFIDSSLIYMYIYIYQYTGYCKFLSSYPCSYRQKKHHNQQECKTNSKPYITKWLAFFKVFLDVLGCKRCR